MNTNSRKTKIPGIYWGQERGQDFAYLKTIHIHSLGKKTMKLSHADYANRSQEI